MLALPNGGASQISPIRANCSIVCSMANPEHLKILARGKSVWNEWRKRNRHSMFEEEPIDLSGADLRQFDLRQLYLSRVNLNGACMTKAALQGALLQDAHLLAADLSGASFRQADCSGSDFSEANLVGADLSSAKFDRTLFWKTNLNNAHGCRPQKQNSSLSGPLHQAIFMM